MSSVSEAVGILLGGPPLSLADIQRVELISSWVDGAIARRADSLGIAPDQLLVQEVIVKATTRYMETLRRSGLRRLSVQSDDTQMMREYEPSSAMDVEILDSWWALLGLTQPAGDAFTITPYYEPGWRR